MSEKTIPEYDAAGGIDASADQLLIWQNSTNTYKKINRDTILGSSATPVTTTGTQTLSNKTLDNSNIITVADDNFTIQDDGDATKQAQFQASSITAGQTRTYTLPDGSTTLVGTGLTQTLTNKTLTSPTINGGTITGTTVEVDAIVGDSVATTGTVYGLQVTLGEIDGADIQDGTITTTQIAADTITGSNINWQTGSDGIWWEELGRTTLGSAGDTLSISNLPARKYLRVFIYIIASGNIDVDGIRFNSDSGANYAVRRSDNSADASATSDNEILLQAAAVTTDIQITMDIINVAAQPKIVTGSYVGEAGSGTAPTIKFYGGVWNNTSNQISAISLNNNESGNYNTGSEIIVLGHN